MWFSNKHSDGSLCIKVREDFICLVYGKDQAQQVKKIEKFQSINEIYGSQGILSVAMEKDCGLK